MSLDQLMDEIRQLDYHEQKKLVELLNDLLSRAPREQHVPPQHWRTYRGVGARLADGTDAQCHIDRLRDEWDEGIE